uniref:Potassium channel subfamily K member n=1 Tax=Geotrypetes seraphini TaxID=260995 RepID=A0A6P8S9U0_GEOSA|nr:potassium channel subfamily K member 6 [Geotrypetes seraphini]XP_033813146.1 potassium channel subfamily K member 6 [Geotrypetes seraphini]
MKPWVLISIFVISYLCYLMLGALVVSTIEKPYEESLRSKLQKLKADFLRENKCVKEGELEGFLKEVLDANKYGVSVLREAANDTNWDFATSFFFASTLVTTVGYGYTTPLSDSGKAFCIFFAMIGVPFTMLVLTVTAHRLMSIFIYKPIDYFQIKRGCNRRCVTKVHFLILLLVMLAAFFLIPAAIFSTIEESWTYLDAFYFCFISLCTIGLGDYVPGEQYNQNLRPLYKICVTFYLLIGLVNMVLILQTFHKAADLHGLTDLVLMPHHEDEGDHERILDISSIQKPVESMDTEVQKQLNAASHTDYSSINR